MSCYFKASYVVMITGYRYLYHIGNPSLCIDFINDNFCIGLTVALFTMIIFSAFIFKHGNLFRTTVFYNICSNRSTIDIWSANFYTVSTNKKHFIKSNTLVILCIYFFNEHFLSLFNLDLLATCFNDCVPILHLL